MVEDLKWRMDVKADGDTVKGEERAEDGSIALLQFSVRSRRLGLGTRVQFEVARQELDELGRWQIELIGLFVCLFASWKCSSAF